MEHRTLQAGEDTGLGPLGSYLQLEQELHPLLQSHSEQYHG